MAKSIFNEPVAIIGAGPVGLAAASQLAIRNIPFVVFESSDQVGANILDWGHVKVFTPWKYIIDQAAKKLLDQSEWVMPDEDKLPTGREIVMQYLKPLSQLSSLKNHIKLNATVVAIAKKRMRKIQSHFRDDHPFVVKIKQQGKEHSVEASGIIDASGTWQNHNPIGAGGIFAEGELQNADKIAYRIPDIKGLDLERYANKSVAVIGGGHSAINSLLELAELKNDYPNTILHWILQTADLTRIYGGKKADQLEARGALGIRIEKLVNQKVLYIHTPVFIHKIDRVEEKIKLVGEIGSLDWALDHIDEVIANTGGRPDFNFLREIRYQADPAIESVPELADLIDPNMHSCGTVAPHGAIELKQPETNFYIVGVKSYGRAPTFLMPTGYEQVRSIAAWLDGDEEAARRVELNLPETGVCRADYSTGLSCCAPSNEKETAVVSCCGSTPAKEIPAVASVAAACCAPASSLLTDVLEKEVSSISEKTSCCNAAESTTKKSKVLKSTCC
ncbi:MAG: NAD(P)-binding domain-containing protein [Cyclobacteriaceae bacterium]